LSLTVLDGQLNGDTETLPVLSTLGDIFTNLLGGQTKRTDLGSYPKKKKKSIPYSIHLTGRIYAYYLPRADEAPTSPLLNYIKENSKSPISQHYSSIVVNVFRNPIEQRLNRKLTVEKKYLPSSTEVDNLNLRGIELGRHFILYIWMKDLLDGWMHYI
jgi:hypothetical protein